MNAPDGPVLRTIRKELQQTFISEAEVGTFCNNDMIYARQIEKTTVFLDLLGQPYVGF